jgi:2,3-bisphosphoglycerate-dependent phosphoglycerate mutase
MAARLILLRHGESTCNRERRFTGWADVPLTARGKAQAAAAGRWLADEGFRIDVGFTSLLARAIDTLRIVLDTMGRVDVPVHRSWYLNERHYGALQGLGRWEAARRYGLWRMLMLQRDYTAAPPPLAADDARSPARDPRYAGLSADDLPRTESVKDTLARMLPYWNGTIVPEIRQHKCVLIVGHRNSLRALIKHLDDVPEAGVFRIRMPTGRPLVYELGDDLRATRRYYLRPPERTLWQRAVGAVG